MKGPVKRPRTRLTRARQRQGVGVEVVDRGAPPCDNGAPLVTKPKRAKPRVFMVCREHGRVVARVYVRTNRVRQDGTRARDRVEICPHCQSLNHKAWYLFGGGRDKTIARKERWRAANRDRHNAYNRAYRADPERMRHPSEVRA